MSLAMVDLPSNPDELRAFAQALQAQHAATVAELASTAVELRAAKATIQLTALRSRSSRSSWRAFGACNSASRPSV